MLTKVIVSTIYSFTNLQAYFQNCGRFYLRAEFTVCKCERGSTENPSVGYWITTRDGSWFRPRTARSLDPTQLFPSRISSWSDLNKRSENSFRFSILAEWQRHFLLCGPFRFSEEIPNEENEINNDNLSKSSAEAKPEGSPPLLHKKVIPNSTLPIPANLDAPIPVSNIYIHCSIESTAPN